VIALDPGATPAVLPRVLLVDDDASIRRLVATALEDMPIDFVACASAEDALAALQQRRALLVITDLMMPGVTGYELLATLMARPALRAGARLVVFSAGLTASARAQLAGLDVWRELDKPVSMRALEACVHDALAAAAAAPAAELSHGEQQSLAERFAGDLALFTDFRAHAHQHFLHDIAAGRQALAAGDLPALHRLAHSLQGVMTLLGDEAGATLAQAVQAASAAGDAAASEAAWPALAAWLRARNAGAPSPPSPL
jgi:DNA-binding response OmpR family regulator